MSTTFDRAEVGVAATMGIGTVQAFTTFVGSIATSDMMDREAYNRGVSMSLGWSFCFAAGFSWWAKSPAPFVAWVITAGAMLANYEYHRSKANGEV